MWKFYALLSAFFTAVVAFLSKKGVGSLENSLETTVRVIIMALALVAVTVALGNFSGIHRVAKQDVILLIASGVAAALSTFFYFLALKTGHASGVLAIDRLSVVFILLLAVLFLGEALTMLKTAGALLIVVGALLMII